MDANFTKFIIDPSTMSYTTNVNKREAIREHIKDLAIKKLNVYNKEKDDNKENDSESSEEEDSEDSNEESSYVSDSFSSKDAIEEKKKKTTMINEDSKTKETYYKISFDNIKYLQYNYEKNSFIEKTGYLKMSKVEMILNGVTDENDSHRKAVRDNKNKIVSALSQANVMTQNGNVSASSQTTIELIHKQIEECLNKKEIQKTIIFLKLTSAFVIIVFCAIGVVFYFLIDSSYNSFNQHFNILSSTLTISSNLLRGVYNIRQLTLLSNNIFTKYLIDNETDYLKSVDAISHIYYDNHYLLNNITTSPLNLAYSTITTPMYVIINDTFNDEYFSNEYNVTVLTFINQVNTALFHTITSADYRPYNSYVYFFLRNSQGGFAALANLCTLAHYSIYDAIDKSIRLNIIFICGIVPVYVLACLILGTMIARAIRRKADYLAVFFDIGNNTIKNSLEKCEIFNTKIQSDNISGEEEGDEEIKSKEEKEIDVKNEVKHHSRGHAKANAGNSEIIKIRIAISVMFVIIYTIFVIMFIFDNKSTQKNILVPLRLLLRIKMTILN